MSLGDDLRSAASRADQLEADGLLKDQTILTLGNANADLERRLAECQGSDWPTGGIVVDPGVNLNSVVDQYPSGTLFRLTAGVHNFSASLTLKGGNSYIADNPNNRPKLIGGGPGAFPFATASAGGITLKGLDISNFGPANTTEGAGMINRSDQDPGNDWLIEDCSIGDTNNVGIRWGPGWTINRTKIHDCGRFAMSGGGMNGTKTLRASEWVHCGFLASDSNRGGCKFSVTKGVDIDDLWTHDHRGPGLWLDIKNESAKLNRVMAEDCTRMGMFLEVSYGPIEVTNLTARRCGSDKKSSEGAEWPVPAGLLISMTPDVTVTNPLIEDCRNGITVIQWAHPQVLGTIGSLDKSRVGNENIMVSGGRITGIQEYAAGLAGTRLAGTRLTRNVRWENVQFDSDARFRSALTI